LPPLPVPPAESGNVAVPTVPSAAPAAASPSMGPAVAAPSSNAATGTAIPMPKEPVAEADTSPGKHWYGWQIIASDATAMAIFTAAAYSDSGGAVIVSAFGYVLVPPLIHAAHHQGARAAGSLALRLAVPLAATLIGLGVGAATDTHSSADDTIDFAPLAGALVGGAIGIVAASAIDISALAYEPEVPDTTPPAQRPVSSGIQLFPGVVVAREGRSSTPLFVVSGVF
jgi:hypothetical protein